MTFRFIRICASNGRHEFQCVTCEQFFWFAPGRELDENDDPKWKHCPACAGWRKVLEPTSEPCPSCGSRVFPGQCWFCDEPTNPSQPKGQP